MKLREKIDQSIHRMAAAFFFEAVGIDTAIVDRAGADADLQKVTYSRGELHHLNTINTNWLDLTRSGFRCVNDPDFRADVGLRGV